MFGIFTVITLSVTDVITSLVTSVPSASNIFVLSEVPFCFIVTVSIVNPLVVFFLVTVAVNGPANPIYLSFDCSVNINVSGVLILFISILLMLVIPLTSVVIFFSSSEFTLLLNTIPCIGFDVSKSTLFISNTYVPVFGLFGIVTVTCSTFTLFSTVWATVAVIFTLSPFLSATFSNVIVCG